MATRSLVFGVLIAVVGPALMAAAEPAFAADPIGPCTVRKEANVPVKMRDGTVLFADIRRALSVTDRAAHHGVTSANGGSE
jgi:hypothetical protein